MTYSIVARDAETGQLGVAAQSCVLAVGTRVTFARHGVGAVAVQAGSEVWYGDAALDILAKAGSASDAVEGLVAIAGVDDVQFGVVDRSGGVAAHTGPTCAEEAGHVVEDGVTAQGNVLASSSAWHAMVRAFEAADGELADRLIAALRAAEGEGGDLRGRQSAAMLVVGPDAIEPFAYHCPDGPTIDLRVDDHEDPVEELERLLRVKRAHDHLIRGVRRADEDWAAAVEEFRSGSDLAPGDRLMWFWRRLAGLLVADGGEMEVLLTETEGEDARFAERVRRLWDDGVVQHPRLPHLVGLLEGRRKPQGSG